MGPDVGAVVVDEVGEVADDLDVVFVGVGFEVVPLVGGEELEDFFAGNLIGEGVLDFFDAGGGVVADVFGPGGPGGVVVGFEGFVGGVVVEPVVVVFEVVLVVAVEGGVWVVVEAVWDLGVEGVFVGEGLGVVGGGVGEGGGVVEVGVGEEPECFKEVWAEEVGVDGEG